MKGILLGVVGLVIVTLLVALSAILSEPQSIIGVPVGRQACEEAAARGDPPPFPECPALLDQ